MKVVYLMDKLDELSGPSSFSGERRVYINRMLENSSGYVKIGDDVQSHAFIDDSTYTIFGGNKAHKVLLTTFLEDHSKWKNLGMDLRAFYNCEKAVLFNSSKMQYTVWAPA